jgi:ankyrin repeat protein
VPSTPKPSSSGDREGRSPLHYAANDGNVQSVRQLLAQGYSARHADRRGWTPLHFAAQAASVEVIAALLDAGAEVAGRDELGNTPLLHAVFNSRGNGDAIELLRSRGADPHARNAHGQTPLGLARLIANYDVARFFRDLP